MKLEVRRTTLTTLSTIGELWINGRKFCRTLELPVKDGLPGSAIPEGTYNVVPYASPKFGRTMPLIDGIPGRSEIEIHYGNFPSDTDGCILLGYSAGLNSLLNSREAFNDFWGAVFDDVIQGTCVISVSTDTVRDNSEVVQDASAEAN